jgi:DNA repair protein RecO (recombination protein O)
MADIATSDQDPNPQLYRNLVTALYLLESGAVDMEVLTLAYEVKLIECTGFRVSTDLVPFPVSKAAENVLDFIRRTEMAKVHVLKVEKGLQKELSQLTSYIIRENYPRRPKSLDLLKYM